MHFTCEVATSARCRIERRCVVRNAVWNSDIQALLENIIHVPDAAGEAPLLHASRSQARSVRNIAIDCRCYQDSIAFIADIQRICIREPNSKGECCGRRLAILVHAARERRREPGQNRDRLTAKLRRSPCWQNACVAHLIDRVDAISTASLGDVQGVVKDGQATEVIVLPRLVGCLVANLRNRELADFVDARRHGRRLAGNKKFGACGSNQVDSNLRPGEQARRQASVVIVPNEVIQPVPFDRRATVIAAVSISIREANMAVRVYFRYRAEVLRNDRVGRIDDARRVGIRNVQLVWCGNESGAAAVTDERDRSPIDRPVHGQL